MNDEYKLVVGPIGMVEHRVNELIRSVVVGRWEPIGGLVHVPELDMYAQVMFYTAPNENWVKERWGKEGRMTTQ